MALTFQPLRRVFEKATDRIFFRDRYDTQTVLNDVGNILTSERHLNILMRDALRVVCDNLRLCHGHFVVLEAGKIAETNTYGSTSSALLDLKDLGDLGKQTIVSDKLEAQDNKLSILNKYKAAVCVRLQVREQLIGYLLLGDKRSGSIYSKQDLDLLAAIAPGLAVATSNAQAYAEIAQFNLTLQKEVAQATQSLRTANENLKVLDKTKDEFLSITSHQLRTPLATIEGYLSILEHGDLGKVSPKQQKFLISASQAALRMSDIVTEILDISTISAGHFTVTKKPEDLEVIVLEEVNILKTTAETKGLVLKYVKPEHNLPQIDLDKSKLQRVIANFIDNAIHYTLSGSISVRLEKYGSNVRLLVEDCGIGIPENEQAKLFDKFFRGSNARKLRPDGTGLGLYMAKQVIKAHDGQLIFRSIENEGSTFGFEIPIPTPGTSNQIS